MAKNKNRKQAGPQNRSSQAEHPQEQAHRSATETSESSISQTAGSPTDVARKKKSFGHN
ncbi:hypothetical protein ACFOZ0_24235 [Streptomyces yaanensis]|uniref:Small hydrophilic protein n=1 Tax=Streptomyces yaanensis TaxID=1142239 RepID=A0ABV7SH98_9ACTN|nr:hypothetical protein [Streptomyces sp. CGMCC 4.7035]WNC01306.1 hypothetical protein Q2K21_26445 [Streptomyces sp. CGMCC 4.7035]